jgi:type IV pilus assembly protein PilM
MLMTRSRSPIGIDLGSRSVKAVQLERAGAGWRLAAAAAFAHPTGERPPLDEVTGRLGEVLERQGFAGRDVVTAVPAGQLILNALELPPRASGAPLQEIARAELARSARVAADAIEARVWDLPGPARASNATHCIAAAVRHADADSLLDALERRGMRVRALDIQAWALCRACAPLMPEPEGLSCILDIGWTSALLALVHGQTLVYQRAMAESGLGTLRDAIADRLDVTHEVAGHLLDSTMVNDPEEQPDSPDGPRQDTLAILASHLDAMVEELRVSLSYASHRYPASPVSQLLLTGGGASLAGLHQKLSQQAGIPARRVCPADLLECEPAARVRCGRPLLMTALGLAQYAGD